MFNPYSMYPQPIVVWPPNPNSDDMDIKKYYEIKKLIEEDEKARKDKDKKKPEPPKFTFFETLGISFTFLMFGGPLYYFFVLKPLLTP